jgi:hypothetical protein
MFRSPTRAALLVLAVLAAVAVTGSVSQARSARPHSGFRPPRLLPDLDGL